MHKKSNLFNDLSLVFRGYKLLYSWCPKAIFLYITEGIVQALLPYFTLYMSAVLVNEIIYSRDLHNLIKYALITTLGTFALNVIKNHLKTVMLNCENINQYKATLFFLNRHTELDYEHFEKDDVAALYNNIEASNNIVGNRILILNYILSLMASRVTDIACAILLSYSLFFSKIPEAHTGLASFICSPYAAIIVLLSIITNALVSSIVGNKRTYEFHKELNARTPVGLSFSNYNNQWKSPDVHIFGMSELITGKIADVALKPRWLRKSENVILKYYFIRHIPHTIMQFMVSAYAVSKAFLGAFPIGNLLVYKRSITKFIEGVLGLSSDIGFLTQSVSNLKPVFEYFDLESNMYKGSLPVEKRSDNRYCIEFKDVSFKYSDTEDYILKNINLKFEIGDKLAIVGMSGSGKTTLIKLLCRLYDPTEGEILLNGINIKKYRYNEYLDLFSVVFQDIALLSFTLAENVACTSDYDSNKVIDCLDKAGLGDKISILPQGIETYLHTDYNASGINVTEGTAQKIALARALYKNAPFIILDEPTASLDPVAEADIYARFNDIVTDKTTLYISHRLASCRFCNNILVFDKGSIVQHGSHEDLLTDITGKYYEFWTTQAKWYV